MFIQTQNTGALRILWPSSQRGLILSVWRIAIRWPGCLLDKDHATASEWGQSRVDVMAWKPVPHHWLWWGKLLPELILQNLSRCSSYVTVIKFHISTNFFHHYLRVEIAWDTWKYIWFSVNSRHRGVTGSYYVFCPTVELTCSLVFIGDRVRVNAIFDHLDFINDRRPIPYLIGWLICVWSRPISLKFQGQH